MSQATAHWIASGLLLALVAAPVVAEQKPDRRKGWMKAGYSNSRCHRSPRDATCERVASFSRRGEQ